ncbi:MAG: hypothetical protein KGL39_10520 [Patescibacteria group bacterium]|nr:hypothetical protein [Patescibacteria group bacterium]
MNRQLALLTAKFLLEPETCFVLALDLQKKNLPIVSGNAKYANVDGTIDFAADSGRLELLKIIDMHAPVAGTSRAVRIGVSAACYGYLDVVRWVWPKRCLKRDRTREYAAANGNIKILQWVRSHGCSWNADLCVAAAAAGCLNSLQWLRANGCPWNSEACVVASPVVRDWMKNNGCPCGGKFTDRAGATAPGLPPQP